MKKTFESVLKKAFNTISIYDLSCELGIAYQSIQGWCRRGRLPRTEWTGETKYAEKIEKITNGEVSKEELLSFK